MSDETTALAAVTHAMRSAARPADVRAPARAAPTGAGREAPSLAEAAKRFEAYLVGEMLRMAHDSPLASGLLDGGSAGRMYRELQLQEIARLATEHGGFGIAEQLERSATRGRGPGDAASKEPR